MAPAAFSSGAEPRTLKCGGAESGVMSEKSSKKRVFSPGTKVDLSVVISGCAVSAGCWVCAAATLLVRYRMNSTDFVFIDLFAIFKTFLYYISVVIRRIEPHSGSQNLQRKVGTIGWIAAL